MNIAYACNDGYIMQTGISLISLFENNRHFDEIKLYMISCGISQEYLLVIESICKKYGRDIEIINFKDIAYDLIISDTGRHLETIYAKMFFERIPGVERMIYIDSDTIIAGRLDGMWNQDMSGYYMGMVQTNTGRKAKPLLNIPQDSPFFNDGMAMVNVDYCRENGLIDKCLQLIAQFNGNPPVLSEGCLNKVCQGHILKLSPRYNMMAGIYQMIGLDLDYSVEVLGYERNDIEESYKNPVIIHFLSGFYNRPWVKNCTHPLRGEFFKYKEISPWKDTPLSDSKLPFRIRVLGKLMDLIGPRYFEKIQLLFNRCKCH